MSKFLIHEEVWVLGLNPWSFTRMLITHVTISEPVKYTGLEMGLMLADGKVQWRPYENQERSDIDESKIFKTDENPYVKPKRK